MDALPVNYRGFVLREIEDLSTAETAACLDLTEEMVKIRLLRARQMLRSELHESAGVTSSLVFQFMGARRDRIVPRVLDRISSL